MRGVGKTQLAAAFARECAEQGWGVVWLSLETSGQVQERFSELAWALDLRTDPGQPAAAVRSWLESHPKRLLLVLDNAFDMNELNKWLPSVGTVTVLITTTSQAASNVADVIEVKPFSPSQAMDYLRLQTGRTDRARLVDLVEELGCLPLALTQAAWVIKVQGRSFSEYLDLLRSTEVSRLLLEVPGTDYPQGVAEAVLLSVQECEQGIRGSWVEKILDCSSVLSPTGIPREIVARAASHISLRAPRGDHDYNSALGKLVEASLLTLSSDQGYLVMHRLVQRVIRDRLRRRKRLLIILAPVGEALMWGSELRTFRPVGGERGLALAEQAIYVWQSFSEATGQEGFKVYDRLRRPLMKRRFIELRALAVIQLLSVDFKRGEQLAYAVLRDFGRVFRGRDVLSWQRAIYDAMSSVGRSDAAIPIAEARLADAGRILGEKHAICVSTRADLGAFYCTTYRFTEAIDMLESALRTEEQAHGQGSVWSHWARSELGNAYRAVGRRKEALEVQKRAMSGLTQTAHTEAEVRWITYSAQRDLALTYRESGQRKKAASLLLRALRNCRRTEGPDSLAGLMFSCDLAMTFSGGNSPAKAVAVLERSLPRLEESLGPDKLVRYQEDLVTAYVKCGRPSDAASLLDRTITTLNQSLGPEHGAVQAMRKRLEELRQM